MSTRRTVIVALTSAGLGLAACYGSGGFDPNVPTNIVAQSGDGQTAVVNTAVRDQLTVHVTNGKGNPVESVVVRWNVASGGGSVTPSSTTDGTGNAASTFTLGPVVGANVAQASVAGLAGSPVSFSGAGIATPGGGGGGGVQ